MRCIALVLLLGPAATFAQKPKVDVLLAGPDGYVVMPAQSAIQGVASNLKWSPNGVYLLATRIPSPTSADVPGVLSGLFARGPAEVVVWNSKTGTTFVPWRSAPGGDVSAAWLAGTQTLVFAESYRKEGEFRVRIGRWSPTSKAEVLVDKKSGPGAPVLKPAPDRALLAVYLFGYSAADDPRKWTAAELLVVGTGGEPMYSKVDDGDPPVGWSKRGGVLFRGYRGPQAAAFIEVLPGGAPTPSPSAIGAATPEAPLPVRLEVATSLAKSPGGTVRQRSVYLVPAIGSKTEAALITSDSTEEALSPTLGHVAYAVDGVVLTRQIVKGDRQAVQAAMDVAERARRLSDVKQIGLAIQMYFESNGGMLPGGPGFDPLEAFDKYVKNPALFEGFVYTYPGGSFYKIDNPSQTELGYIPVAGGRVVTFADGHARFIKD